VSKSTVTAIPALALLMPRAHFRLEEYGCCSQFFRAMGERTVLVIAETLRERRAKFRFLEVWGYLQLIFGMCKPAGSSPQTVTMTLEGAHSSLHQLAVKATSATSHASYKF
jgi:hypothetical protein